VYSQALFKKALKNEPSNSWLNYDLVEVYIKFGKIYKALKENENLIKKFLVFCLLKSRRGGFYFK